MESPQSGRFATGSGISGTSRARDSNSYQQRFLDACHPAISRSTDNGNGGFLSWASHSAVVSVPPTKTEGGVSIHQAAFIDSHTPDSPVSEVFHNLSQFDFGILRTRPIKRPGFKGIHP